MFKPMMQELLNIKQFSERKFKNIKFMFLKETGEALGTTRKPLISGFFGFDFIIFIPKARHIFYLNHFYH
jgi:hypothetical protein